MTPIPRTISGVAPMEPRGLAKFLKVFEIVTESLIASNYLFVVLPQS